MRKVLVATHCNFATGIKQTLEFILGSNPNVQVMCAYLEKDFDIDREVNNVLNNLNKEDELIVMVDVFGGSVSNSFSIRTNDPRIHLISGVNFPMLCEVVMNLDTDKDINSIIEAGVQAGKEGIVYVNKVINQIDEEEDEWDD